MKAPRISPVHCQGIVDTRLVVIGGIVLAGIAVMSGVFLLLDPAQRSREAYARKEAASAAPKQTSAVSALPDPAPGPEVPVAATLADPPAPPSATPDPRRVEPIGAVVPPEDPFAPPAEPAVEATLTPKAVPAFPMPAAPAPEAPPPVPQGLLRQGAPGDDSRSTAPAPAPLVQTLPERYLFNNMSAGVLKANPVVASGAGAENSVSPKTFAPVGEVIELALLDNFLSQQTEGVDVSAAVWYPFIFGGRTLLQPGDKILGKAARGKVRNRAFITWYKVIFKDGRSLPISAVAQMPDGSTGVEGRVVGSVIAQAIAPILFEAAAGFISTFQDYVLVGNSQQGGVETAAGGIQLVPNSGNAAINAGRGALEKVADLLAEDMEENKPYLVIPAGTRCRAYLTTFLDTSGADYGK